MFTEKFLEQYLEIMNRDYHAEKMTLEHVKKTWNKVHGILRDYVSEKYVNEDPREQERILGIIERIIEEVNLKELPVTEVDLALNAFNLKLNGTAINQLTRLKPKKKDLDIDPITGNATVKRGNFKLTFTEFTKIAGLKTSTHQLLDALMIERTKHGGKDLTIRLKLDKFIEMRGLKDRKEARKQVEADLETLFNARLSWTENTGRGNKRDYYDMRLISAKGIEKGVITATLTSEFSQVLEGYYPMPYAKQTLRLSGKYNPNSYYFLNCIQQHKNMNIGKKNENLISVQTLLDATPDIPTYEEVANSDRMYQSRIIEPFERDMDALDETLTWEYCHSNSVPLTDEELENMDYYTFEELLIQTYWRAYPDQTERIERKFSRITEKKRKKGGGNGLQRGG